ncbi:hypothetical protein GO495_13930 [Chitinophaga oryziterrae]|uniref:Uncharacterized protein n=1 Tax=Chitinophaga oryziterrae TaxID=1031224 RepID=A0A6N8J986_9BACT|nr:hypothetical protein [Chitinophaga oryziterrae]MVT41683.1 hypothetical protein [Chitinophaga oryziterrae]
MELITIFENDSSNRLLAVRYDGNECDEFDRLFEEWNDVEYLYNFLELNKEDLNDAFLRDISIEEAAAELLSEADLMEEQLYHRFENGELNNLFVPLRNGDYIFELQESKGKVKTRLISRPKIRIYAIRIATNVFIITGGAIKLTQTMQDRAHTQLELKKLKQVKTWLKENGIEFPEDLNDLQYE